MYIFKFGKYKGSSVKDVMKNDSSYLMWINNTFENIDKDLAQYINDNKTEIINRSSKEECDFLRDWCDGEVSIEY